MSRIRRIPMPEGGAENTEATFFARHNCELARSLKRADPKAFADCDEVMFPVGVAGAGMPGNTPFVCESVNPCEACGTYLRAWFEWATPRIFIPGVSL